MKVAKLGIIFGLGLVVVSGARGQSLIVDFTSPGGVTTGVSDLVLGFEFQVNSPVTVIGLADFAPTAAGNRVGLWDASQNLLATATVNSADPSIGHGFFNFAAVPSTALLPGSYYVGAELDGLDGSDAAYTWDGTGLTTLPQISNLIPAYEFGGALILPDIPDGGAASAYFGGNVVVENRVPDAGTTIGLFGLALTGLGVLRRRFRTQ